MSPCPVCLTKVLDSDDGIQCDNRCERWFHIRCINMSKTEYGKYANDNNKKWLCNRSDCVSETDQPINQLINQMSDLCNKMSHIASVLDKMKDIPTDLADIKTDIKTLSNKFDTLEPRLSATEDRVTELENKLESLTRNDSPEDILREINERSKCKNNLIIFGLTESTSNEAKIRKDYDTQKVSVLLHNIRTDIDLESIKVFRVGIRKKGNNSVRPLKIALKNEQEVGKVLVKFDDAAIKKRVKDLDIAFQNIFLARDKTLKERKYLSKLRDDLKRKTDAGEQNLTIKYRDGIPTIVKQVPKN